MISKEKSYEHDYNKIIFFFQFCPIKSCAWIYYIDAL